MTSQNPRTNLRAIVFASALFSSLAFFATHASADTVVFNDDMNYADNTALQAAWTSTLGSSPSAANAVTLTPTPLASLQPSPASGSVLAISNGVTHRELGTTLTQDWTLDYKVLSSSYSRVQGIYLLNEAGTQGYGVNFNANTVDQFNGNAILSVQKFNNSSYTDWNTFGVGTELTSANSGHAVTGYVVTATSGSGQGMATYDTSTWNDFLSVSLSWAQATGLLTLSVDGVPVATVNDTSFSSFSRVYLRGHSSGYFDSISVSTTAIPEPSVAGITLGGAALAMTMSFRRRRGVRASSVVMSRD